MSYRFEPNESTGAAVERIALAQLDKALEISRAKAKLDDAVHDVRVCFKRMRGLIRLVRGELGNKLYKRENTFYRDLNRHLSDVRDTAALAETFEKLEKRFADELAPDAFASVRKSLARVGNSRQAEKRKALIDVRKKIVIERNRIKKWSIKHNNFSAVGDGLERIYEQGRTGFRKAYAGESVEAFHEWRKQAKYLWYQIRLLRKLWPRQLKRFADQIEKLVEYLSDDHDLAILRAQVLEDSTQSEGGHEHEALLALIDKRRAELQTQACFLGQRIYAEKTRLFIQRYHEYWKAWQSEQKTNPLAAS